MRPFDDLMNEAAHVAVEGWNFSWLTGRATEERPRDWSEIARVLVPGGTYFSQQVGPASMAELTEAFLGPQPDADRWRRPEDAAAAAEACGLEVVDLRLVQLRAEFHDIGAIIYVLRKCVWWVPDFSVERYLDTLHQLHRRITSGGSFVAHASRFLIEARRSHR